MRLQGSPCPWRAGLLAGALAVGTMLPQPAVAQRAAAAAADTAALMMTVRALAADSMEGRKVGTEGGIRARRYLVARLSALGLAPLESGFEHPFPLRQTGAHGANLLGLVRGTRWPDRYIVLSAHHDHLGVRQGRLYPGADDNASGVAGVLAIAAELMRRPPLHSVIIALLDGEEAGLLGARAFVARPPVPLASLLLDVNLDMIGHNAKGELWASGGSHNPGLVPLLDSLRRLAAAPVHLRLGHDRAGVAGEEDWTDQSDQGPFHAARIPFVYFGEEDHPDYHQPSDRPATLTPLFFAGAVTTILEGLRMLDRSPLTVSSRAGTSPSPPPRRPGYTPPHP